MPPFFHFVFKIQSNTMTRVILMIALIPCGIFSGWALKRWLTEPGKLIHSQKNAHNLAETLPGVFQKIALIGLNPLAFATSIWVLKLKASGAATLPFIGLGTLAAGMLAGKIISHLLQLSRNRSTVFSISSSLTNIGSIGSLVVFYVLGEQAFALVPFYKFFEELWSFGVCFPMAARTGEALKSQDLADQQTGSTQSIAKIFRDPFIRAALIAILVGLGLNASGLSRPDFFRQLNVIIVPLGSFLLLVSIGMKIPKRHSSLSPSILLSYLSIRVLVLPAVSFLLCTLFGVARSSDQSAFHVALTLSVMPAAFTSLLPPMLYDLDFPFSFNLWIASNFTLVAILPAVWLLFH